MLINRPQSGNEVLFYREIVLLHDSSLVKYYSGESSVAMTEYEIKKKGDVEKTLENASDKVQAGARAVVNKVKDPSKDLDTEYAKEKIKEKFD